MVGSRNKLRAKGEKREISSTDLQSRPDNDTDRNFKKKKRKPDHNLGEVSNQNSEEEKNSSEEAGSHAKKTSPQVISSSEELKSEQQLLVTGLTASGEPYVCPAPMIAFQMTPFALPIRKGNEHLAVNHENELIIESITSLRY